MCVYIYFLQNERRNIEWKVDWLMFADDTVLLGDSEEKLERLVQEFGKVCQRRKLPVNETKSKIMIIGKNVEENGVNISLNDRRMKEVETYIDILEWTCQVMVEWVRR